jgi:single-stranded DNA-binding protein
MLGLNKCVFKGSLLGEPFMTYTKQGDAKTTFKIAVAEEFQGRSRTTWIPLVLWREVAEQAAQNLATGHVIQVTARFRTWSPNVTNTCEACGYETTPKIYKDEFEVEEFKIIGKENNVAEEIDAEDLPF